MGERERERERESEREREVGELNEVELEKDGRNSNKIYGGRLSIFI